MCAYNRVFAHLAYNSASHQPAELPVQCTNHCRCGPWNAGNVGRYGFLGCICQICEDLGSRGLSCWNASLCGDIAIQPDSIQCLLIPRFRIRTTQEEQSPASLSHSQVNIFHTHPHLSSCSNCDLTVDASKTGWGEVAIDVVYENK